jgi:PAS domain S-box-containing protein
VRYLSDSHPPTRAYLRLPFLIAAIAVVTAATWIVGWRYVERALLQIAGEALALGASEIAIKFDRMVFERYADMRIMAGILSSPSHRDPQFVRTYLDRMRDTYGNYHWLGVADRSGRIVAASPPTMQDVDVSRTTWFEEIRARAAVKPDAMFMGGVDAFGTEHGAPDTIAISAALYDPDGTFQGAVTSRVSIPVLEAIAVETIRSLQGRHSMLANIEYQVLDNDGVAYIDSDLLHKGRMNVAALHLPSFQLSKGGEPGYIEEDHVRRRIRVMTGYSLTRGWGQADPFHWTVLVRMPTEALIAPIQTYHLRIGTIGLAILSPIFSLLIWMQRRLRRECDLAQAERLKATSAQAQYHLLLQTTDQGIFGLDHDGRCTFINRAAAAMLGYEADELLHRPLHEVLHPPEDSHCCSSEPCLVRRVLETGRGRTGTEQVFRRRDGAPLDVECAAFPLEEAGSETSYVFTCLAIAERKQRTEALLSYQARLQSLAAQLRKIEEEVRQRLATELHDNLAQTLALCHMKLAALQRAAPAALQMALTSIAGLLKEALSYTRELMSDLRPPTLGNEGDLAAAAQWVTAKLERHGLTVTVTDDRRPKPLDPDVLRIAHQSLHELLFNVLKHSGTTAAAVRIRRLGRYVAMQVRDRGMGFRAGSRTSPTQDGGFGLFNLREQLAVAGGFMRVTSVPGEGARVTILLPLRTVNRVEHAVAPDDVRTGEPAAASPPERSAARIRVLLVDDHQIMRQGLRSMIEGEKDYEVVAEAVDGEMAVELAGSLHPDVVLMDINMPRLNGIDATRRITQLRPDVAVIGLSMHEDPQLEQLMYEAGAAAYLSKGTAFNLVCDTIRRVVTQRQQQDIHA